MCDRLTQYVEVTAMKDQKAATMAAKFTKKVILRYGAGLRILTDQRTPFMSKLMKNICKARRTRVASVYTKEQRNKVDSVANWFKSWSWTTYVPITLLLCAASLVITGTMIECIECYKQVRHQRNIKRTTIKTHSHKEIEFDPNNNLFRHKNGCIHHQNE